MTWQEEAAHPDPAQPAGWSGWGKSDHFYHLVPFFQLISRWIPSLCTSSPRDTTASIRFAGREGDPWLKRNGYGRGQPQSSQQLWDIFAHQTLLVLWTLTFCKSTTAMGITCARRSPQVGLSGEHTYRPHKTSIVISEILGIPVSRDSNCEMG